MITSSLIIKVTKNRFVAFEIKIFGGIDLRAIMRRKKMKKFYSNHKGVCWVIIFALCCAASVLLTLLSTEPMSEEQIKYCQDVAQGIYEQNSIIYDEQEDVVIDITENVIEVKMRDSQVIGKVTAKLQNGKLVFDYNSQVARHFAISFLCGIELGLVALLGASIFGDRKPKYKLNKRRGTSN
jgi:hypothetical protein